MNEEFEQLKQTVAILRADVNMANAALIAIAAALEKGPLQSLCAFDLLAEEEIANRLAEPVSCDWPPLLSAASDRMRDRFHKAMAIFDASRGETTAGQDDRP